MARIQEKKLSVRNKMEVERGGRTLATVHKALVGIRDRFDIEIEDGDDLKAHGNVVDHEYEIERDGDVIATVSKKCLRARHLRHRDPGGRGRTTAPRPDGRDRQDD